MISASQLKSGSVIETNNAPHIVQSITKQTPSARGGSTLYKIRAKNLLKPGKIDLTCKGDDMFKEPDFQTREVQYLYAERGFCNFMDLETYDQMELAQEDIADQFKYLLEDMEGIHALILNDHIVGIRLPDVVVMKLVECDPAIKGASATARTKPATTETGLVIQVPEYMENGEIVKIETSSGKFLSRA